MSEIIDYSDVPCLQDILDFLPIEPNDREDIGDYIRNITNLITINYKSEQYQFAYFGIHLLYMTYIYCTAWKISQINSERYRDAIIFARPYNGREKDFKIDEIDSIFAYSLIPEKDIAKIFKIIDLDPGKIGVVCTLVDIRNDMAHASGKFEILTEDSFDVKTNTVLLSIRDIHQCMVKYIRKWFSEVLISYCSGEYKEYSDPKDIISEQIVQNFKLSLNELIICNDMSVSSLITFHRGFESKLKQFKKTLDEYCKNMGYCS